MQILITGAAGFIGFNLSKYLFTLPFKILNILDFYHDMIASNKKVSSNKIQKLGNEL